MKRLARVQRGGANPEQDDLRFEALLARRHRRDTARARLPYLAWHKELVRPPAMARWERVGTVGVGVLAGLGVAAGGASPTGSRPPDVFWAVVLGVAVAAAGTLARRRVLLAVAIVATVGAWGWWSLAGVLALGLVSGAVYQRDGVITGERFLHALSAGLALQALVRMPGWSWMPFGATALVATLAIGAVLVAGWWRSPPRVRTRLAVATGTAVVVLAVMGASLWRLFDSASLTDGAELAADGTVEGLRDLTLSTEALTGAEQRLGNLQRRLDTPLLAPLRFVPLAAQQVRAVDTAIAVGLDLTGRAGDGAALVEGTELRPAPGQVDVVAVRSLEAPLQAMVASLQSAGGELASVQTPWLVGPVRTATQRLTDATTEALPSTELALLGVQTVPGMLGADGPRRWLIQLIDTESGTEEWQVVVADNGKISMAGAAAPASTVGISAQELLFRPDFAFLAQATAFRFEAASGVPLDGLVMMGAQGTDGLLEIASSVPNQAPRDIDTILTVLLSSTPPAPSALSRSFSGPDENHIVAMWSRYPAEALFAEGVGLDQLPVDSFTDTLRPNPSRDSQGPTPTSCSPDVIQSAARRVGLPIDITIEGLSCVSDQAVALFRQSTGQQIVVFFTAIGSDWDLQFVPNP